MTYIDVHAGTRASQNKSDFLPRLFQKFRRGLQAVQCARMQGVLNTMPDEVLDEIGVSRSEIRAYSRRLVYEAD